jgi:hypothetical protein
VENLFMSLKVIFEKLFPSYSKKLWKCILDESVHLFIQMLLICSVKYAPSECKELAAKVSKDKVSMKDLFSNIMSSRDIDPSIAKLTLIEAALTGPHEDLAKNINQLRSALVGQWNDNCSVD